MTNRGDHQHHNQRLAGTELHKEGDGQFIEKNNAIQGPWI
jgi:hypothetical protein